MSGQNHVYFVQLFITKKKKKKKYINPFLHKNKYKKQSLCQEKNVKPIDGLC